MTRFNARRYLIATALTGALLVTSEAAGGQTVPTTSPPTTTTNTSTTGEASETHIVNYLDLQVGAGFSSNPRLGFTSRSSAFGRVSASGVHNWSTERSSTTIHGYVENTTYLRGYGSQQIFDVGANTSYTASPTVSLYGGIDLSGDINGQLSNRLLSNPSGPPVIPDPGNPLPPPSTVPNVLGFNGHNYRLNGQGGATIRTSELSSVTLTAGAQHSWFTGRKDANYTSYFGSVGYSRSISERTSLGGTLYLQRQDYSNGGWANVVNPTLTLHTQLSETMTADGAVGVLYIEQKNAGIKDHNVSPSFSGSVCNNGTISRFCVRLTRDASSALDTRVANLGTRATIHTTLAADYYRQLSATDTISAQFTGTHYTSSGSSSLNTPRLSTSYFSAVAGYDKQVGHRLAVGVTGGVRKLFQVGPDPKTDVNGNVYLRYRIGDL
jgi:hypothetical protein